MFAIEFIKIKLHIKINKGIFDLLDLLDYISNLFIENIANRIFNLINLYYNSFEREFIYFTTY